MKLPTFLGMSTFEIGLANKRYFGVKAISSHHIFDGTSKLVHYDSNPGFCIP